MSLAVNDLIDDPELPEKVDALRRLLETERERREQFYDEVSEEEKAEFINGEIVMHSPVKARHLSVRDNVHDLLRSFCRTREVGTVCGEKALCVFPRNDYEPDVVFFGPAKAALIQPETLKFPIPDFICEVLSDSTERRDRGVKFRDFEAHEVGEYWLIDAERELLEQYLLRDGRYELALKSGNGEVASVVVPGFRIPIRALLDDAENLRVLRALLA